MNIGKAAQLTNGTPVRIVGYRQKIKGPILDTPARYVVFVEQSGDYRMGTVRAEAVRIEAESGKAVSG